MDVSMKTINIEQLKPNAEKLISYVINNNDFLKVGDGKLMGSSNK